ncbi:hypothetical protein REPUB_Repub11eG0120200 [Reevesia pubescens]
MNLKPLKPIHLTVKKIDQSMLIRLLKINKDLARVVLDAIRVKLFCTTYVKKQTMIVCWKIFLKLLVRNVSEMLQLKSNCFAHYSRKQKLGRSPSPNPNPNPNPNTSKY